MMHHKRFIALLLCYLFTATLPLYASVQFYKVTKIFENDTLNVRQGASTKTPILRSLPYNTKQIEIIQRQPNSKWVKISTPHSRVLGWVNSRYLKPYSEQLPTLYACSGTEPFWRADIHIKTGKIDAHILSSNDNNFTLPIKINTRPSNSPKTSRVISGNNAKYRMTAFITEGSCSDGMSDKVFDYQITSLMANKAYSGCCDGIIK